MARDRNLYVWQAYVIVMSFVSLLCIGALCYVVFQSGTNFKQVKEAETKMREADAKATEERKKSQLLSMILGSQPGTQVEIEQMASSFPNAPEVADVQKKYNADMALFGPNSAEKNYRKLVETLMQTVRENNSQVEAHSRKEVELNANYETALKQWTINTEAERKRADTLASQLEQATVTYTQKEKERQDEITQIKTEQQRVAKQREAEKAQYQKEITEVTRKRDELAKQNEILGKQLEEIKGEDFQYVQGKITEVTDGGNTVYLNLGKADGLRPGVRFAVLDDTASKVADQKPKARLEVVDVNQQTEHLSRARVLPDRKHATILRGDKIYSPAWQPGRKVSFGLVGKLDIDGDGKDDRDTVRALIAQNGGDVSVDLRPDGRIDGNLSVNTRWLVVGDEFKVLGDKLEGANEVVARRRLEIEQQAKSMGVSRINLDKLMGYLRGSGEEDVVPLGSANRASDFIRREAGVPSTGRVSGLYQSSDGKSVPSDNP
jgi:hypothetical protein